MPPAAGSGAAHTPPPPERRGTPRSSVEKAVEIRLLDDLSGQAVPAWLTNVSASGIAVRLNRPVARGREFVLLLPGSDAAPLRYRVVRCQASRDEHFQIGAAFVRAPVAVPKRAPATPRADGDDTATAA
jgi:hypothetical protein